MGPDRTVRVACIQLACTMDQEENLATCLRLMHRAGEAGADLIVFPEFSNHPSYFVSTAQVYAASTPIPGPFVDPIADLARRYRAVTVLNVIERQEYPDVWDTSVLIEQNGTIAGTYRKHLLHRHEHIWLRHGDEPIQVFDTSVGRIGLYVCADGLIPDLTRCLALEGAEIIVNSMNSFAADESLLHVMMRGIENRVWSVLANKVGKFPGTIARSYIGGSEIVSPSGEVLVRASWDDEEVIVADITPVTARDKRIGESNDLFADRRPATYALLTRPNEQVPANYRCTQGSHSQRATYRVAAIQVGPENGSVLDFDDVKPVIEEAFLNGASVFVLPELFAWTRESIAASPAAAAEHSRRLVDAAREYCVFRGLHGALGIVTSEAGRYYSALVLVGDDGNVLGEYRQVHQWCTERDWATPGEELTTVRTRHGDIGLLIGYDLLFPEAARVVAGLGADLILCAGTWRDRFEPTLYAVERAGENQVNLAVAARPDSPVSHGSVVIPVERFPNDPVWTSRCPLPVTSPAGNRQYAIAAIDPTSALDKRVADHTDVFAGRQPHNYEALVRPARHSAELARSGTTVASPEPG